MKKALPILFLIVSLGASGQTWVKTTAPDSILYRGIRTWGEDTIYAWGNSPSSPVYPNTLVSSFDGGQTWTVGPWQRFNTDQVVATPAGLFAGYYYYLGSPASGHLDYTTNGTTWQTVPGSTLANGGYYKPLGLLTNGKLLLANSTNGKLNISPDYISLGSDYGTLYQYNDGYTYYAINPTNGRIIFGQNSGTTHMQYTDDNAVSFTDISLASVVGNVYSPIVRYTKNNTFFNARMGGITVSTDNGNTWTACANIGGNLSDMQANKDGQVIFARSDNQIMSSSDNGQTWTSMNNGLPTGVGSLGIGKTTDGKFWLTLYGDQPTNGGIYVIGSGGSTAEISNSEDQVIQVYPNPTSDLLNIEFDGDLTNALFTVSSLNGQTFQLPLKGTKLDVSSLESGVYFLQVEMNNSVKRVKFLKN
ncbi:T9SS type A sorting domain-containing protein [Fluviicola taffensis]|uniref:Uncharacterized protein n=1 Tax=Fluviicola taffensis (strain DSM 16823 / NCIMB 13979 / RW262) TaxID=755732 RepID=F2IG64_FLUTR|nr:T9SS type A sorting domain-containing protein [Fluviicola taffensis]AEA44699.1 hypothetical protein Fluta_2718 [Fluviicola taffensis DSM 16823]